jgi:hypothetical protein
VRVITSKRKIWVDTMMREKLELFENTIQNTFLHSIIFTALSFLLIGIVKGRIVGNAHCKIRAKYFSSWWDRCTVAYTVGYLLGMTV